MNDSWIDRYDIYFQLINFSEIKCTVSIYQKCLSDYVYIYIYIHTYLWLYILSNISIIQNLGLRPPIEVSILWSFIDIKI